MPRRRPQQCDQNTQREHSRECVRKKKKGDFACSPEEANRWMPRRRPQQCDRNTQRERTRESVRKKKKVTKRARLKKPIGGCLAVDLSNAIGTLNVNIHESVD